MSLLKRYDPDHKMYVLELFDNSRRGSSRLLVKCKTLRCGAAGGAGLRLRRGSGSRASPRAPPPPSAGSSASNLGSGHREAHGRAGGRSILEATCVPCQAGLPPSEPAVEDVPHIQSCSQLEPIFQAGPRPLARPAWIISLLLTQRQLILIT